MKDIKVIELFAGVGGFRVGLENVDKKTFNTVWSNQWEPSTKKQHASEVYCNVFGKKGHSNEDINNVDSNEIPNHDLLVGGFPCQTFSIMRPKNKSEGLSGIKGDKGILFWEIYRIAKEKNTPYLFLENVDRLLISPAKQKGRDMAVIIKALNDLDYIVEWRIINAAEYGMVQKRKRAFIFAYKNDSEVAKKVLPEFLIEDSVKDTLKNTSVLAQAFPIEDFNLNEVKNYCLDEDFFNVSEDFNQNNKDKHPFLNCGISMNGHVHCIKSKPKYDGDYLFLRDIILPDSKIEEEFFADDEFTYEKWRKAKDRIHKERVNKVTGECYIFKGGAVPFPDKLDSPARTIITSEGGSSASRTTHVINPEGRLRRLHPIELERIQGFPDNHTKLKGVSNAKRGFLLGNALVVGVVERFGEFFLKTLKD